MSAMFEQLKEKYERNYIRIETLAGWVAINDKVPGKGITKEEYEEITGTPYIAD